MFFTSLNSGSNGNCYYIGNQNEAVLVDAGISCREIEKRMASLGLDLAKVKAVIISHEHNDHVRGLAVLVKKHRLPVYITTATLQQAFVKIDPLLVNGFCENEPVTIGSLTITCFKKFHDACDPYSFVVSSGSFNVGVFTDIGTPCASLIKHFKTCHAAFLESNYDEAMLEKGSYPYHLKRRIRGGNGHLSNHQALTLFLKHRPSHMQYLLLSHLSGNNNCPTLVNELFAKHAGRVKIFVASRNEPMALCQLETPAQINVVPTGIQMSFAFA